MKKLGFTVMLLMSTVMAYAIKPLTTLELSTITSTNFVCNVESIPDADATKIAKFYTSPATVTAEYVEENQNLIKVTNFTGKEHDVEIAVDWDNGTLTMQPQQVAVVGIAGFLGQMTRYMIGVCSDFSFDGVSATLDETKTHTIVGTVKEENGSVKFELTNVAFYQIVGTNAIVYHYPFTVSFAAERSESTGVNGVQSVKNVKSKQYVNLAGQVSTTPFEGMNVVKVTYTDGSVSTDKKIY